MPLTGVTLRVKSLVSLSACSLSFTGEASPQIPGPAIPAACHYAPCRNGLLPLCKCKPK